MISSLFIELPSDVSYILEPRNLLADLGMHLEMIYSDHGHDYDAVFHWLSAIVDETYGF